MRIIFTVFLLSYSLLGMAQTQDGSSALLQEVTIDSLDLKQSILIDRTKEWIGKTFNSGEKVISSETSSSLVGSYIHKTTGGLGASVNWDHRFIIDVKDNRIRIKIWVDRSRDSGYTAAQYWYGKFKPSRLHKQWLDDLVVVSGNLIISLESHLRSKGDDW
jgi:hypothetical protein